MNLETILDIIGNIFEYIRALPWPIVTFMIFLVLSRELKGLMGRISSIKLPGKFEFNAKQSKPSRDIPKVISKEAEKKEMEKIKPYDKEKLATQTAALQVALHFERTYNLIFGSQIALLDNLRKRGSSGLAYEDVAAYYQGILLTYPFLSSYPLSQYLDFLKNSNLIGILPISNKSVVKITVLGIDFLEYIESLKYNKNKLY